MKHPGASRRRLLTSSRLDEGLAGAWTLDGDEAIELGENGRFVDSPFGKALSLDGANYEGRGGSPPAGRPQYRHF